MSESRDCLNDGLVVLMEEYPIEFVVDGFPSRIFYGLCDEVSYSNEPGPGGFLPDGDGTIGVPVWEFAKVGFTPFPGMRLTIYGRDFIANAIGKNGHRWRLTLEQGHPKKTDLPAVSRVIGTQAGPPVGFEVGQVEVTKAP